YVDVQLDLVAVRIDDVQAVRDAVIGRPADVRAGDGQGSERLAELLVGGPDLEPEVVHADPSSCGDRQRVRPDLDEKKLVMRASRGEHGHLRRAGSDLLPSQEVSVELPRRVEVADVQHDVAQLLDLHLSSL